MSTQGVKEVKHVRDLRMVNKMIEAGWVLLIVNPDSLEDGSASPLYIMGWKHNRVAPSVMQDW
ncbi:hypothetical protein [Pseudomonas sp. TWR3-1-1]|uniref:hypothetical protein n=1 Tax=Pseudomonas sp. TWR3-1-1 TaxID=2804633 RepID=UPI003CFABC6C